MKLHLKFLSVFLLIYKSFNNGGGPGVRRMNRPNHRRRILARQHSQKLPELLKGIRK